MTVPYIDIWFAYELIEGWLVSAALLEDVFMAVGPIPAPY